MLDMNHLLSMQINNVLNSNQPQPVVQNNILPININNQHQLNNNGSNQNTSFMFKQTNNDNLNLINSSNNAQPIGSNIMGNSNNMSNMTNMSNMSSLTGIQNSNLNSTNDFIMSQLKKLSSQVENLTSQLETKQKIIDEFTKQNKASENKQQRIVTQDDKMFTLKPTFSSNNLRK